MANSINGIELAHIAQESLRLLTAEMPKLSGFTTDFSSDVAGSGTSVTTRIPVALAASDASGGYNTSDASTVAKTVTLNKHIHVTVGFTDFEVVQATLATLERAFIAPLVYGVTRKMMDDVFALATAANFPATAPYTNFGADAVTDLSQQMTVANVPLAGRSLYIRPDLYNALAKDDAIQAAYAFGSSEAVREGRVPRVAGFDIIEYNGLPVALAGMATSKEGILIAARQPATPRDFAGAVESVTESGSGLTLQFRSWYDANAGQHKLCGTLIYGVAVGVAANVIRIED